ncbi:glycoside hydrolase family 99-like domain-containing protein [Myxococcaceae bacterium GXIMD 01537]
MVKAICFYLPQYHPVKENDEWWGEGFTEWRNVAKAVPNFAGHYQPHVPSELGFYDLRLVEVQKKQAEMAKAYGVYGFCYYYYWFNGRRILERPLEQMLAHPEVDMPFCVCWANENWTRTWDGKERDILLGQEHTPEDDEAFIRAVIPMFRDPRYIRVNGKPMLVVYRVDLFPDMKETAKRWRRIAKEEGFEDLHLCAVQFYGITDPRPFGFDAAVEFPPHQFIGPENRPGEMPTFTNTRYTGHLVDYQKVVAQALQKPVPDYLMYRGLIPSWDNTARRQDTSHTLINASPMDYQFWLRRVVEQTRRVRSPEHQFVFINAWNEWGEGCHLEPDLKHGRAYLKATQTGLMGEGGVDELMGEMRVGKKYAAGELRELADAFEARERSIFALQQEIRRKNVEMHNVQHPQVPAPTLTAVAKHHLNRYPRVKQALKKILRRGA